jgi:hypothetical protein
MSRQDHPGPHFPAAHAVFAYLVLDLGDPSIDSVSVAESELSQLDPDQLVRIAAIAGQLQDIALHLSRPSEHDFIDPSVLARARQAHERAVPQVYKPPGSVVVSLDPASGKYTPAAPQVYNGGWLRLGDTVPTAPSRPSVVDLNPDGVFNEED